jgi:hypothetical protein
MNSSMHTRPIHSGPAVLLRNRDGTTENIPARVPNNPKVHFDGMTDWKCVLGHDATMNSCYDGHDFSHGHAAVKLFVKNV